MVLCHAWATFDSNLYKCKLYYYINQNKSQMKILKYLVIGLVSLVVLVFIVSMFFSSKIHAERSVTINAPVDVVFAQVNTLKNWPKWDPWMSKDPNAENTYEGPESGVGSIHKWKSKVREVGSGAMTLTSSVPNESLDFKLEFEGRGSSMAGFKFKADGPNTMVTWSLDMDAGMNPIMRIMGSMMDKMIGPDFEKGLNNLKELCEKMPKGIETAMKVEETTTKDQMMLIVKDSCKIEDIGKKLGSLYQEIGKVVGAQKLEMAGAPFAIYPKFDKAADQVVLEAGISVNKKAEGKGAVKYMEMKSGKAAKVNYYGDYMKSEVAHNAIQDWVKANNKKIIGAPWEVYVTDPMTEKDTAKWLTEIYYPIE